MGLALYWQHSMKPTLSLLLLCLGISGAAAQNATPSPQAASPVSAVTTRSRPPAANYVTVGNFFYDQGKYDQAYVAFRAANEIDPMNAAALLGLGRSQVRLRLYEPAITTLRSLTKVDSKNLSGYIALSQAYQQQYIGSSDRKAVAQNLDTALLILKDAEQLVTAQSDSEKAQNQSKILNERGNIYRLKGDASKAIDALKQASALNPGNSLILFNLGDMYFATGDLSQAISYLQQAVILDPRDAYNRAYYAKLLALSGNLNAARSEASQAARLSPNTAYAVGQDGVVSYLAKDPAQARTQLNRAIELDPLRYPEFYYYLGRLDLDASDLKSARDNLTKAVALGSNTPEYSYYLGLSYERGTALFPADRAKARENYQRVVTLAPAYQAAQDALKRLK